MRRYSRTLEIYTAAYTAIDERVWQDAIDAEMRHRGAGVQVLIRQLEKRGLAEEAANASAAAESQVAREVRSTRHHDSGAG